MNKFIHRDISWLSFNYRILLEARDPSVPLIEKIKFLSIFSSNLDEFYRVRVAALKSFKILSTDALKETLGFKPKKILKRIRSEVDRQQLEYGTLLTREIIPELKKTGIRLYWNHKIPSTFHARLHSYFLSRILPHLHPVIPSQNRKKKPFLENRLNYLAVVIRPTGQPEDTHPLYGYVNIPSDTLPRFYKIEGKGKTVNLFFVDDIIRLFIHKIFPGYQVTGMYAIKLNRDASLNIEDEFSGDFIRKLKRQLLRRKIGDPSRFLYDKSMPSDMLHYFTSLFNLDLSETVAGGRYHNLHDLALLSKQLTAGNGYPAIENLRNPIVEKTTDLFKLIRTRDVFFHFPYHSFDQVIRFFGEASIDSRVTDIRITLYRIAPDSLIASSLINAAKNGKKVVVFVEVKARFDEENNLLWANRMKTAGIKIIYSLPGLKVHAKIALVKRKEETGTNTAYGYLGTGNFNEVTSGFYTDHGLFTSKPEITTEIEKIFEFLQKRKGEMTFNHLLVSQFNILPRLDELISKEIQNAGNGKKSGIWLKINNLEDHEMISRLYDASRAGVPIQLIVRSICCLMPGKKGMSENIRVRRIVDRFLEHGRIYIFHNEGEEQIYLGSADWMKRNLRDRIEVVFPVLDPILKKDIKKLIELQLMDNTKARELDKKLINNSPENYLKKPLVRSQMDFYHYLRRTS